MIDNRLKVRQTKPTKEELAVWADIDKNIAKGDFIVARGKVTGGQQLIELSASSIIADTMSEIVFNDSFKPSFEAEYGFSLSQRTKGIFAMLGVESLEQYDETFQEYTIASMSQSTTTLTVTLNETFNENIGYWVDIYGLADNRFNYTNLNVNTISADKKTLTFTHSDEFTITSLSATPANVTGGKLKAQSLYNNNFARYKYTGTVTSQAQFLSRFNSGLFRANTVAINGTYSSPCASPSVTYLLGANGNVELKATNRAKITMNEDTLRFMDSPCDSNGLNNFDTPRGTFTEVKPSFFQNYRNVMRIVTPKSVSKPIAKVISAVKSGSNLITIVTDRPHNLVAGVSFVGIAGQRDATNFPMNQTQVVTSTPTPTTFTIPIGTTATSTTYGGLIFESNGQVNIQGLIGQSIQSVARDASELVTLIGSASWSGLQVGEYVDVYGCLDSVGTNLGLDGAYRVFNISTTTLVLEPIKNMDGTYVLDGESNQMTPSSGTMVINTTNCGGSVILRTTARLHDIMTKSYKKTMVEIEGRGVRDESLAIPVIAGNSAGLPVTQGVFNGNSGSMTGQLVVQPAVGYMLDQTSGAITSTTTTSSIINTYGNGFQVSIHVTAVSGTNPTMDVRIEESLDGGTNWITLYDFQRITATGIYSSPMLRATGRHIRYVQTITGTSPSFTRSIIRNFSPMIPAEPQKRLIDRTISLTTLGSTTPVLFQGAANNVQLVINLGAATTPPVIQLEGSEDGVNFYSIGNPLTGVASNTVQLTVNGVSCTYTRAKVTTVGATVTAGYVAIKAWS